MTLYMTTRYGHKREMEGSKKQASTPTPCILNEYGKSMARSRLEYGWSMGRVWLEANILFPRWEQNIPTLGTKHSQPGNKTSLRLVIMLLLMVVGATGAWGQVTDYSGVYYLSGNNQGQNSYNVNNTTTNFYLCPTENWIFYQATNNFTTSDNGQPFLTTYQYRNGTNDHTKAVWIIVKHPTQNYYYIIHAKDGKYMTSNDGITGSSSANRIRVHLEETNSPTDNMLFDITYTTTISDTEPKNYTPYYDISPKNYSGWFLNITQGNRASLQGTSDKKDGPEYTLNGSKTRYVGGTLGFWNQGGDYTSKWYIEDATLDASSITISNVSSENNKVTVTVPDWLPAGYNIRYTLGDGSQAAPTASTSTYIVNSSGTPNEIFITESGTLKVVIERYGVVLSEVQTKAVVPYPMCGTPQISFDNSTNKVTITPTPATADDVIYYTDDGGTPTTSSSTLYTVPFSVTTEKIIKAIATHSTYVNSLVATLTITKVATPTIINDGTNIVMDCATEGATIYYTTDGSDPLGSNKQTYTTGFIAPSVGTTIRAIAVKENCINSAEETFTVKETCQMPVISLNYQTGAVTITSATEGATIRYTLDGSAPDGSSTEYTSLTLTEAKTVKAKAFKDGLDPSAVTTESYSQVATPTVQKDAVNNVITISCDTEGASIRYTIAASAPDYNSTAYTDPLSYDASNKSIKAKAFKEGMVPSAVGEGQYKLQLPAPTITVGDNLTVTLATVPEITGISYKYTTNGSDPSSGTVYSGTISSLTGPATVKAISTHTDFDNSPVASAFVYYTNTDYVLQQKECKDFFLTQADVNNGYKRVTTTNIPSDDIVWHFENANDGYYYIARNNSGGSAKEYLCLESGDDNFRLISSSDFQSSGDKNKYKFSIIQKVVEGITYYNFQIKGENKYVQKNNGNNKTNYVNAGTNSNHDRDLWGIKAKPTTHAEMTSLVNPLLFSPFTNATPSYYNIQNVANTSYYIYPSLDANGHTYAKGTDNITTDKTTRWYLKVAEETVWNTYYYIVNAETGLYMKFAGTAGSDKAITVEDKGTGDKYKFLIVKTANGNNDGTSYNIIPKELESRVNQVNNSLQLHDTPTYSLKTSNSRDKTSTQWIFVLDDAYIAPPSITQNTNGESEDYLKITIECPEGYSGIYDIYYNADGTDPTIPALNTEPTAPTSSYSASFLPVIDATTINAVAALKTDHSKTSTATSFVLPQCETPTVSSFTSGNVTLGTTTTGASIYYTTNNTNPVLTGTPSSSASAPEIACSTNSKTTIKAVAAKQGMQPSDVFTQEAIYMPTITFTGGNSYPYTGSDITPTLSSVTVDGDATDYVSECVISEYSGDRTNVGSFTVAITHNTSSSKLIYGTVTFDITPAGVTLTANSGTETYDGTEKSVTGFTCSVEGLTFANVSASGSGTNAGTYPVTFTGVTLNTTTDATGNYVVTNAVEGTLTINPIGVTLTANSGTETYDGTEKTVTGFTCSVDGLTFTGVSASGSGTNAGDYPVNFSGLSVNTTTDDTGNYVVTSASTGWLTINQKTLTITPDAGQYKGYGDTDPSEFTYTYSGLVSGDEITFNGALGREEGEDVGTYAFTLGTLASNNTNYALEVAAGVYFTIMKSIGNGTIASGFTVEIGENNSLILKDGETTLEEGTPGGDEKDFIVSGISTFGRYSSRTVTGKGTYTGYFIIRNAIVNFQSDADAMEWSATFVAENAAGIASNNSANGHKLPDGITAYIITAIEGNWAIPKPLEYIPEGIPVLLVSDKKSGGFEVEVASGHEVITTDDKNANMLEARSEIWADIPAKTIYLLYKNEFVYNMAGDLAAGKVYLNPNHTIPSPSPAPSRLRIKWEDVTGIEGLQNDGSTETRNDSWYTLDGRKLSSKPTRKGMYIVNREKVIIR